MNPDSLLVDTLSVCDTLTVQLFSEDAVYIITDPSANIINISGTWILFVALLLIGMLLFKS